jgi:hypothetical protein
MTTQARSPQPGSGKSRPKETKHLHFDLSHYPDHNDLTLHVGVRRHALKPHRDETRAAAAASSDLLRLIPGHRLTHFVEAVELPADAPILLRVTSAKRPAAAKLDTLTHAAIHIPTASRHKALIERWRREDAAGLPPRPHPKLKALGVKFPGDTWQKDKDYYRKLIVDAAALQHPMDVAITLVMHHPELMSLDPDVHARVNAYLEYIDSMDSLARSIMEQATTHAHAPKADNNWVNAVPATGADMSAPDPRGLQIYSWSKPTRDAMAFPGIPGKPLSEALQITKDAADLKDWSYVVQPGTTCVGGPHQSAPAMFAELDRPSRRLLEAVGDARAQFMTRDITPNSGVLYSDVKFEGTTLSLGVTNQWVRWLSVYVEFLGPDGKTPVKPEGWTTQLPAHFTQFETDTKKYLQWISARNTILGIPVKASPTTITFPWPTNNPSGARILCGGVGCFDGNNIGRWDDVVCPAGAVLTAIFNYAVPIFFLISGTSYVWPKKMDELVKQAIETFLMVLKVIINGPVAAKIANGDISNVYAAFGNMAMDIMVKAVPEVTAIIVAEIGSEEAVEEAVPIAGWIVQAASVVADMATIAQTVVEVLASYATMELDVNKVMDVKLTVAPDEKSSEGKVWPSQSDHWQATLQYSNGPAYQKTGRLDATRTTGPIEVAFSALPAGGTLTATFAVYSSDDWLCGKAESVSLPAPVNDAVMLIPAAGSDQLRITQFPAPLTVKTRYLHKTRLVYDGGHHHWSDSAAAPTATAASLDATPSGNHLTSLAGITLSQLTGALGYVWNAAGLKLPDCAGGTAPPLPFAFQNISVVPANDRNQDWPSPKCSFAFQPCLVYDLLGPRSQPARNFYFDPRNERYHLRRVILDRNTEFSTAPGQSFGRFHLPMNALAVHTAGYVVGVSTSSHKLEVLPLMDAPVADADAPSAMMKGGLGRRPGLFHSPLAVVTTVDGRILVLDQRIESAALSAQSRIQALDVHGNPVSCFAGKSPEFMLKDDGPTVKYLDMGVESKGYVYVLKIMGDQSDPANYMLDIYNPDGTFLVESPGVTAGKLAVSLWRDVYTLNYEMLTGPNGPEPSVSWWSASA